MREQALRKAGRRGFQADRTACAKALRQVTISLVDTGHSGEVRGSRGEERSKWRGSGQWVRGQLLQGLSGPGEYFGCYSE